MSEDRFERIAREQAMRPPIHANGNGATPHQGIDSNGIALATISPLPEPSDHCDPFDRFLAELEALETKDIQGWLLDHAEDISKLGRAQIEKFTLRAMRCGVTQKFIDRSWRPVVNSYVKLEKKVTQQTISQLVQEEFDKVGWSFSLNECTAEIFVNQEPIDEGKAAEIRVHMRDRGFAAQNWYEDWYIAQAYKNSFHPVKEYLEGLVWDKGNMDKPTDHIAGLSRHLTDAHELITYEDGTQRTVIHAWLHRWLIGAVAKIYEHKAQNPMLVLDGGQDLGKSTFAQWFGSSMPKMVIEKSINPDDTLMDRYLAGKWIWEVAELGATTSRANREALKAFLTRQDATFKVPYAIHPVTLPALSSFIGTINAEQGRGFLSDPTGNRRFLVVELQSLDWSYEKNIDIDQVWAQAYALYKAGEPWRLTKEELARRDEINGKHEIHTFTDDAIDCYFKIDLTKSHLKAWQMTGLEIANKLSWHNIKGDERSLSTQIGNSLAQRKVEKRRGNKNDTAKRPQVYCGIQYTG